MVGRQADSLVCAAVSQISRGISPQYEGNMETMSSDIARIHGALQSL